MLKIQRSHSIYQSPIQEKVKLRRLTKNSNLSQNIHSYCIGIGIFLASIIIVLQFIAFLTPHWKEISPNAHSFYVDGIDALLRTETFHFFNAIYRHKHHSYGLFQRCEYTIMNSSELNPQHDSLLFINNIQYEKCTKNLIPSYDDDLFDNCHSLVYYQFCLKSNRNHFNTKDNNFHPINNSTKSLTCECRYPSYVSICRFIGIVSFIFLFLTLLFFILFPFMKTTYTRLKIKCFGASSSFLASIFLLINLCIILQHLEFEPIEYLVSIRKHYQLKQIYQLSKDTELAIERFLSTITIRIGYSTIISIVVCVLSIIDGIILLYACRINHRNENNEQTDNLIQMKSNDECTPNFEAIPNELQSLETSPSTVNDELVNQTPIEKTQQKQ